MPNTHKTSVVTERISNMVTHLVQSNPFQDNFDRNREAFLKRIAKERQRVEAHRLAHQR